MYFDCDFNQVSGDFSPLVHVVSILFQIPDMTYYVYKFLTDISYWLLFYVGINCYVVNSAKSI
jgi:hypothetical protein